MIKIIQLKLLEVVNRMEFHAVILLTSICMISCSNNQSKNEKVTTNPDVATIKELAKQATIYGYPIVEDYRVFYQTTIDTGNVSYRAPINQLYNNPKLVDASYVVVQAPNGDTFYAHLRLDLRNDSYILGLPEIEEGRYYSAQVLDMYTQTETVLGTRIDGNNGGKFLVVGPGWNGEVPEGIIRVVHMDTEFAYVHYRTQVFNPADVPNVVKIQDKYTVASLNELQGKATEDTYSQLKWSLITKESEKDPENFFNYLNAQLAFMPVYPEETELRKSFEEIGVVPGTAFTFSEMSKEDADAIKEGFQEGLDAVTTKYKTTNDSKTLFGSHDDLGTDYLSRAAGQMVGLYGLPKEESVYASNTIAKEEGQTFDTSKDKYILRFEKGQLPPADAFWSVTMYDGVHLLFVGNPLNRYLINSPMLNDLKFDKDGRLTIYIQKENPGKDKEANWLPAPDGTFFLITRIYMPQASVLNNEWVAPQVELNN